jgi:hypothetical protein
MSTATPACIVDDALTIGRTPLARLNRVIARGLAFISLASALCLPSPAAAIPCADLPSPLYGVGSSAETPLFRQIAKQLAQAVPASTLVFQAPGACVAGSLFASSGLIGGTATYWDWDQNGIQLSCDLPIAGQAAGFASSAHVLAACAPAPSLPPDVVEVLGPVLPIDFIVPTASNQTSISAPAAYFVYGFGAAGQAEPWTDPAHVFAASQTAPPLQILAEAIGVPASKLQITKPTGNGGVVDLTVGAPDPDRALGLVSAAVADANRSKVRALAYQHFDQSCGYWPDSTPDALDKRNVRDGHYALWAPIHLYARVDAQGVIVNPAVASLVGALAGDSVAPGVDLVTAAAATSFVPRCAMQVWRADELGPLSSSAPADPCGCAFEAATGATSCQPCTTDGSCPGAAPRCRHGYCELY